MLFHFVSIDTGVGLTRDMKIIGDLLHQEGHDYCFSDYTRPNNIKADVNLFIERVAPVLFPLARKNYLIPNPEWYLPQWESKIKEFDYIFVKTREAERIFKLYNPKVFYTSFTSRDMFDGTIKQSDTEFLLLSGKSRQKRTEFVCSTWMRNKDFPMLHVVRNQKMPVIAASAPNIDLVYNHIPDEKLKTLMNVCGVHICVSETEGFGHYIMEALSSASLVVTTNAPPMNELVTPDRGLLCNYTTKKRRELATSYYCPYEELVNAVTKIMNMSEQEKEEKKRNAREFYLSNDKFFKDSFLEAIRMMSKK